MKRRFVLVPLAAACVVVSCAALQDLEKFQRVACLDCDGGSDAIDDVRGAETSPDGPASCTHLFCANFDGDDVSKGWSSTQKSAQTTLTQDRQIFQSPPASLVASVPSATGGALVAELTQKFEKPPTSAKLEFDLRLGVFTFPDAGIASIEIAAIQASDFESGGGVGAVALVMRSSGPALVVSTAGEAGTIETVFPLADPLPTTSWVHVTIDVKFGDAAQGSVKVSVGGKSEVNQPTLATSSPGATATTLRLGLSAVGTTPAFQINVDNLTFDVL